MSGTAPLSGFSVTLGGVYASQGAPDNRLVSLRPPA
jgi:hypothetical protein